MGDELSEWIIRGDPHIRELNETITGLLAAMESQNAVIAAIIDRIIDIERKANEPPIIRPRYLGQPPGPERGDIAELLGFIRGEPDHPYLGGRGPEGGPQGVDGNGQPIPPAPD